MNGAAWVLLPWELWGPVPALPPHREPGKW